MMRYGWLLAGLMMFAGAMGVAADESRIGIGVNYWRTIDSIDVADIDESGASWLLSYQLKTRGLKLEADLEVFPDEFAGSGETSFQPQAFVFFGDGLYGGAGVGMYYNDGEFSGDPIFMLRAGLDVEALPGVHLDLNAVYRFEEWDDLTATGTDIDSDTVTIGAAVRIAL